jgi:hypothetical protein
MSRKKARNKRRLAAFHEGLLLSGLKAGKTRLGLAQLGGELARLGVSRDLLRALEAEGGQVGQPVIGVDLAAGDDSSAVVAYNTRSGRIVAAPIREGDEPLRGLPEAGLVGPRPNTAPTDPPAPVERSFGDFPPLHSDQPYQELGEDGRPIPNPIPLRSAQPNAPIELPGEGARSPSRELLLARVETEYGDSPSQPADSGLLRMDPFGLPVAENFIPANFAPRYGPRRPENVTGIMDIDRRLERVARGRDNHWLPNPRGMAIASSVTWDVIWDTLQAEVAPGLEIALHALESGDLATVRRELRALIDVHGMDGTMGRLKPATGTPDPDEMLPEDTILCPDCKGEGLLVAPTVWATHMKGPDEWKLRRFERRSCARCNGTRYVHRPGTSDGG